MYVDAVGFDGAVGQFVHGLLFDSEVMACHFGCDGRASKFPHQEMFNLTPNSRRRGGEFEIPLQIGELLDLGGQRWKEGKHLLGSHR